MEWTHLFHAFLSLLFVIGLLLLTVYFFKYCEQKGLKSQFIRSLKSGSRINVVETKRLDARCSLYLVRCDDTEYLFLANSGSGLLLSTKPLSPGPTVND